MSWTWREIELEWPPWTLHEYDDEEGNHLAAVFFVEETGKWVADTVNGWSEHPTLEAAKRLAEDESSSPVMEEA